jgi:hypothetical protein
MPSSEMTYDLIDQGAGDQKPFGMTVTEWQLAAGSVELGIGSATLMLYSLEILEFSALSAIGTSFVLSAGIATLVIATMEALGLAVPDKGIQTVLELIGAPFSLVGGAIGIAINGERGLELGACIGGILELMSTDVEALSSMVSGTDAVAVQVLNGFNVSWASATTEVPRLWGGHSSQMPSTSNVDSAYATKQLKNLTQQLKASIDDPSSVRQHLPQTYSDRDHGDRWTHPNPLLIPVPNVASPPPPAHPPAATSTPNFPMTASSSAAASTPSFPTAPLAPAPHVILAPRFPSTESAFSPKLLPDATAEPYENSSCEQDQQEQSSLRLP